MANIRRTMMAVRSDPLAESNDSVDKVVTAEAFGNAPDDLMQRFDRDGYFIMEQAISTDRCAELLQFIISSFAEVETDHIIAPAFRMHTPLLYNALTRASIGETIQPAYDFLDNFLEGGKRLVELSSITVFPNAEAQNLHPDESNPGKFIVSVFVNLTPTCAESGALLIVPGSHLDQSREYVVSEAIPVEVPAGSAVFMNSKTWHCGGGNRSTDRIRPVFYFSFGDQGLEGPTYSIRDDVMVRGLALQDFKQGYAQSNPVTLLSVPKLNPSVDLLHSIFQGDRVFVIRDGDNVGSFSVEEGWILDILRMIEDSSQAYSLGEIAARSGCIPEQLLQVCEKLHEAGIVFCETAAAISPAPQVSSSNHGYSAKPTPVPGHQ